MKTLLVAPDAPYQTHYGLGQRIHLLYRALALHSDVRVLVVKDKQTPYCGFNSDVIAGLLEYDNTQYGRLKRYQADKHLARWFHEHLERNQYDALISQHLSTIYRIGGPQQLPSILDFDDADHLVVTDDHIARSSRRVIRFAKDLLLRRLVRRAVQPFRWVWFTSARDRDRTPFCNGDVLPNIPFTNPGDASFNIASHVLLWVGALDYAPNYDGLLAFVQNSWPVIHEAVPSASLRLAGRASESIAREFSRVKGVNVLGFVENLDREYHHCRFTIAPIFKGGGHKHKGS